MTNLTLINNNNYNNNSLLSIYGIFDIKILLIKYYIYVQNKYNIYLLVKNKKII